MQFWLGAHLLYLTSFVSAGSTDMTPNFSETDFKTSSFAFIRSLAHKRLNEVNKIPGSRQKCKTQTLPWKNFIWGLIFQLTSKTGIFYLICYLSSLKTWRWSFEEANNRKCNRFELLFFSVHFFACIISLFMGPDIFQQNLLIWRPFWLKQLCIPLVVFSRLICTQMN